MANLGIDLPPYHYQERTVSRWESDLRRLQEGSINQSKRLLFRKLD